MTVRAIYENGVFRPTEPVDLPEKTEVQITWADQDGGNQEEIRTIMRQSYPSGQHDVAERHDEHQP